MNWSYILPELYRVSAWVIVFVMGLAIGSKFGAAIKYESNQRQLLSCQELITRNRQ